MSRSRQLVDVLLVVNQPLSRMSFVFFLLQAQLVMGILEYMWSLGRLLFSCFIICTISWALFFRIHHHPASVPFTDDFD